MSWESELFDLLDDLEGQAQAAFEADREAELADRARAEYASVTLAGRLMASLGAALVLELPGVGRVQGELRRVGQGWCLVRGAGQDWIVPLRHVALVQGASDRSVPEVAWSPVHRLGLSSAMRRLADSGARCLVHVVGGRPHEARVLRVGADFMELETASGDVLLTPYDAVVAVQSRDEA